MIRGSRLRYPVLILLSSMIVAVSAKAESVKLAVFLPLSNVYESIAATAKQGFELGIQEEVAAQKVPWESWVTLEYFDTRSDADHTLQLVKEAIAGGAKAILGPAVSSKVGLKIQNYVLHEAKVPLIVFAGNVSDKMRTTNPLFIRFSRSIPIVSTSLANWLKAHPIASGAKPRWACVHSDYVFGVGVCDAFKRAMGQMGEEMGRVPIPLKTVRMKKQIIQLAKMEPDVALVVLVGGDAQTFYQDYYRFKVHERIPLVLSGTTSATTAERLQAYEKTLEQYGTGVGIVSAIVYASTADNAANQHFVLQYRQKYDVLPDAPAMWGYDTGRLLVKALAKLEGKWDGTQVVQLMKTMPYASPRHGQQLQFDTHGDVINVAYIHRTTREGARLINKVIGQVPPINIDEILK